ncbi:hypothetical protein [Metabacillus litoralis]|uniref:hypothetical protein n=1 Tax=Metabacillus litoralis TaxID=152268 RepID=UPI000EF627F0|nr:hypothetical protein [Metabacillus litoralis]
MRRFLGVFVFLLIIPFLQMNETNAAGNSGPVYLGFEPADSVLDPDKPIIYLTRKGANTVYSINYKTGEMKTLNLPYPTTKLEIYQNKLVLIQHKMAHDSYNFGSYKGAIALVDINSFTLDRTFDIVADPYDIAVDKDGYVYVSPGSGQWNAMKVYSLKDGQEVPNNENTARIYDRSTISYNAVNNKIYTITPHISPSDLNALEINKGTIFFKYDSPYHGDYPLTDQMRITPDGLRMFNNSGIVFWSSSVKMGDMVFQDDLGKRYNDYAFNTSDDHMYAADVNGGIDVYSYENNDLLYSIKTGNVTKILHYKDGFISIYRDDSGYYLDYYSTLVELKNPTSYDGPYFTSINHNHPIARLYIKQPVPLLKRAPNGSYTVYKQLKKGEYYRTFGILGNYYHLGGGYYVRHEKNKMGLLIGRLVIRKETTLYSPDGKPYRKVKTNELIRVYNYDDYEFDVGGGYYIKNDRNVAFYVGFVSMLQDTKLYAPSGEIHKTLKKGESYRVYSIDGNKFQVGGGYYIIDNKNQVSYMKN